MSPRDRGRSLEEWIARADPRNQGRRVSKWQSYFRYMGTKLVVDLLFAHHLRGADGNSKFADRRVVNRNASLGPRSRPCLTSAASPLLKSLSVRHQDAGRGAEAGRAVRRLLFFQHGPHELVQAGLHFP
jgi:hypothetical protein